jgi:hypothetical protein
MKEGANSGGPATFRKHVPGLTKRCQGKPNFAWLGGILSVRSRTPALQPHHNCVTFKWVREIQYPLPMPLPRTDKDRRVRNPRKFHRNPDSLKQIIGFRRSHFARKCCISETVFSVESTYVAPTNLVTGRLRLN